MKNILIILLTTITLASCEAPIKGSGTIVTEIRDCKNFNAVISDLAGNVTVTCKPDTAFSCKISAQENIIKLIECSIEKDELLIRFKRTARIATMQGIEVQITMPTTKGLKMLGSGNGTINGNLVTTNLLCAMMGSGNINVTGATIGKLRADITGSGNIEFANSTSQKAEYALKGSGKINANNAPADSVKAIVAGSGSIECMAVKIMDAEINGSGNIKYLGKPLVIRNKIGGNGSIQGEGTLAESAK